MYVSEHSAAHIFLLKGDEDDLSRPRCQFIPKPLWVVVGGGAIVSPTSRRATV